MATRRPTGVGVHAHGCTSCHARYEDVCSQPNSNGLCTTCHGHQPWSLLIAGRLPRDCCRERSRPATKEQLKTYRLSTACEWFRCPTCSRTFPYDNPKESA